MAARPLFRPHHPCLGALIDPPAPDDAAAVPLLPLTETDLAAWCTDQPAERAAWVAASGFRGAAGSTVCLPSADGSIAAVLAGLGDGTDRWALAGLPERLAPLCVALPPETPAADAAVIAEAWALGAYRFDRYKSDAPSAPARLVWPEGVDRAAVARRVGAAALARDLVNTPASDLGPADLAGVARALAEHHGATLNDIVGDALLDEGWPAVHAVGRGSTRPPRLIDLRWGNADHPRVTLVGKGVVFDSGGLNLKPSAGMKLMKKDMGGAAHALGLAHAVMDAGLPVRLRVLIPAVENMPSGSAFRPLDVLETRKGLTVEVGDTDAEGRLILADALAEADTESPALLIDMATLTGAARVALGPDVPAVFTRHDTLAADLMAAGEQTGEPLWRLPLHAPYRRMLDSPVADLSSIGTGSFAGAITAALFLAEFVGPATPWAHLDLFAWAPSSRPGRPEGGTSQALNALFAVIEQRFGSMEE
ncbi:leucyl aminopeptidase family protein [Roseospira marina]|uniref:Leucyl aminopeptidase family protein n=1 Tax=Roseospira marina TaxID=140057 RepID=A0A5M6IA11_9PROT|nr:leucyl aminopeptidase family protein [Roseospira marina]KAA5605081.1 leucyl aminopeptidase family protein [Roseospira marina]MBB4314827.1 leucyl aminopeptidase [Roseospira marina]MBB5087827.1 leucyl aminopeptidase [Roseospira marina]